MSQEGVPGDLIVEPAQPVACQQSASQTDANVNEEREMVAVDEWTEHLPASGNNPIDKVRRCCREKLVQGEQGQGGAVGQTDETEPAQTLLGGVSIPHCREQQEDAEQAQDGQSRAGGVEA